MQPRLTEQSRSAGKLIRNCRVNWYVSRGNDSVFEGAALQRLPPSSLRLTNGALFTGLIHSPDIFFVVHCATL